jgi:hypothetical protein
MNNMTDIYTDIIYDYIHNNSKINHNSIYYKYSKPSYNIPNIPTTDFGTKDIFYTGGNNNNIIIDNSSNNVNDISSINISYQSFIISILQKPPFYLINSINELTNLFPYLAKYSTNKLIYSNDPNHNKLYDNIRQNIEVLSIALKDNIGRDIINKFLSSNLFYYLDDIESKYLCPLNEVDSIYNCISQYLFLSKNLQRTLPRNEIILETSKELQLYLIKWMYINRFELLPNGYTLFNSINEYSIQFNKEFNDTFNIISNNKNFFNPTDLSISDIIDKWSNLDPFIKYIISLQFNIPPSKFELLSLSIILNHPIIILNGYTSELYYSPINVYTPFNYNNVKTIPIFIIKNINKSFHLLWIKYFGLPANYSCNYPKVSNKTIHTDKKSITLNIAGSSQFIINKSPINIINLLTQNIDKHIIYDLPDFLKKFSNTSINQSILSKNNINNNSGGNNENNIIYKIGKFSYSNKTNNIASLSNKNLPKHILNSDIPIDVFMFNKHGAIQLFNLSNKQGQINLNKAYKNGLIIRNSL